MTKRQWHSGPPPSVGWWPASVFRDEKSIRWWDGYAWSMAARPTYGAIFAADIAEWYAHERANIEWTERWWE